MRKITEQAKRAFNNNTNFKSSNTEVEARGAGTYLYLHGNMIASKWCDSLAFSMCGWPSTTTRERLMAASIKVCQRKGKQYFINGNDDLIEINSSLTYKVSNNQHNIEVY